MSEPYSSVTPPRGILSGHPTVIESRTARPAATSKCSFVREPPQTAVPDTRRRFFARGARSGGMILFAKSWLALVAIGLAGCASYPKSNAVAQFAVATNTATTLLQNASKLDLTLAQRNGYEVAVTRYLVNDTFAYPPRDFALLDKQRIAARIAVLDAIGKYAAALAAVEDPQQPAKIGEAVSQLGSVVTAFVKVSDPEADVSRFGPVAGIVSAGATYLVAQRSAIAIRDVANTADPWLKEAADLLARDLGLLNTRYRRRLAELAALQKQKAIYLREDQRVSRIELEKRYLELYTEYQQLAIQVATLDQSKKILKGLIDAHDELRSSEDVDRQILLFKTLVEAISTDVQALKKARQS